jgi:hypothetical protein
MMVAVPMPVPVTAPVIGWTLTTPDVGDADQNTPGVLVSVVVVPRHILNCPEMGAGLLVTVTSAVE